MARSLNGTNQGFVNTAAAIMTGQVATLAVRVNFSSLTGTQWLVFNGSDFGQDGNLIGMTGSAFYAQSIDGGGTAGTATHGTTLSTGVTYNAVATFASNVLRTIYVNELTPVSNTTDIPVSTSQALTSVGERYRVSFDQGLFTAANLMQDVAFWNVALTADEVLAFMRGVSPRFIRPASLRGYLPMLETSGNIVTLMGAAHPFTLTQINSPSSVNPAPTLPILRPRFGLATVLGAGSSDVTVVLDPSADVYIGGDFTVEGGTTDLTVTLDPAEDVYLGGVFSVEGGEPITVPLEPSTDVYVGGSFDVSGGGAGGGWRGLIRNVTRNVTKPVTSDNTGGSASANPNPPAGDAIDQLLASMSPGHVARINNRSHNIYTGPNFKRGYTAQGKSLYSRELYDLGFMKYGAPGALWPSDAALRNDIMGVNGGGGSADDDRAQLIYGGMGYSFTHNIAVLAGGGHSSGAGTHLPFMDVGAACRGRLDGLGGGIWDQFTDPAPYARTVNQGIAEGNIYPPYGRDGNWPALAQAFDAYSYPQPIDHDLFPEWYTPIALAVNGDGDCPPYATHSAQAIEYDDVNDQLWRGGYNVALGNNGTLNSGSAGGTCTLDYATRSWTRRTGSGLGGGGGGGPYFRMAPNDENYMFVRINAFTLGLLNIAAGTTATVGTGNGDSNEIGTGGITLIENLHTVGYWALAFFPYVGTDFAVEPKAWPPGAPVDRVILPSGGYIGDAKKWDNTWGMDWRPVDRKIYVAGYDAAAPYAFKLQAVDPFRGNATGQAIWEITDVTLAGLAGDSDLPTPVNVANYTEREMYNRVRYLPAYDALLIVTGYQYGDVYLIKLPT